MYKKLIISVIAFVLLMILAVILGYKLTSLKEKDNNITEENIVNEVKNEIEKSVITESKNEVVNNTIENNIVEENNTETEIEDTEVIEKNISDKQKALEIAENNWGSDDTIYFDYDGTNSNGDHMVCVRDKNTTQALYWYKINVETGEFTIE